MWTIEQWANEYHEEWIGIKLDIDISSILYRILEMITLRKGCTPGYYSTLLQGVVSWKRAVQRTSRHQVGDQTPDVIIETMSLSLILDAAGGA